MTSLPVLACWWLIGQEAQNAISEGDLPRYESRRPGEAIFHDNIGNRTQTQAGGAQNGANLRVASYGANNLNQYTNRQVPGAVDVMGVSIATNVVTVNGQTAYRKGEYFRKEVSVANNNGPVWQSITVAATGQSSVTGNEFVPRTPEVFGYDLDGNLTSDGQWLYTWDAENRLVAMTVRTNVGPQISMRFEYDATGRRIRKQVWSNTNWTGTATSDLKFAYDGWNLIAALSSGALQSAYVWGMDLSGSMQGAGGVGGLLETVYYGTAPTNSFAAYDGNGNVIALVKAADGTVAAQYEYGPFGEALRATGPMGKANPFRWSTRYQDDETDIVMYPGRPYNASTARWLSKDPIQEAGGINPYCFVENNPISGYDPLGLWNADVHFGRTAQWAGDCGIQFPINHNIGIMDAAIDDIYPTWFWTRPPSDANWSWHFNRSHSANPADDSRLKHRDEELGKAKRECTNPTDSPYNAAAYLGRALHPLQDWVAHGDFDRWSEAPSLSINSLHYWHNWDADGGWWSAKQPDNPGLDAGGDDGRPEFSVMHLGTVLSNGDMTFWTRFHPGSNRIRKTEQLTKDLLAEFQDYVRANAKPCGECRKLFLRGN